MLLDHRELRDPHVSFDLSFGKHKLESKSNNFAYHKPGLSPFYRILVIMITYSQIYVSH